MFSLQTRARRSQASAYTRSALEGGHSGGDRSFVRERIERKNFGPSWACEAWESRRATFGQLVPCRTRVTGVGNLDPTDLGEYALDVLIKSEWQAVPMSTLVGEIVLPSELGAATVDQETVRKSQEQALDALEALATTSNPAR